MSYKSSAPEPHTALNVTKRCNQRCVFCFEGDRAGWDEPSLDEVRARLTALGRREKDVIFMGAEALLRPDVVEVVRSARAAGLRPAAFTNGQAFARKGLVSALAEAGLTDYQLSAHYADADSFARGTGTPARLFDRWLAGLDAVAEHNRRRPDRPVRVAPKTVLFRHNAGRVAEIASLLRGRLGPAFSGYMISCVNPTPTRTGEPLLEPFAERRRELSEFMKAWPHDVDLWFSMVPLCLIPGWEHYSYDARVIAGGTAIFSNFADKRSIGEMHDYVRYHESSPYRWQCRDCGLLPLCPAFRASWREKSFLPGRDQRFEPSARTAADVLRRLERAGALRGPRRARSRVAAHARALAKAKAPEHALARALRSLDFEGWTLGDLYCEGEPVFTAELRKGAEAVTLRLRHPKLGAPLGLVSRSLTAEPAGSPSAAALEGALRALDSVRLPPLSAWDGSPGFDPGVSGSVLRLWKRFGAALRRAAGLRVGSGPGLSVC